MTEPNDAGTSPVEGSATPPVGAGAEGQQEQTPPVGEMSREAYEKELQAARREAAKYRTRAQALEDEKKSETEKQAEELVRLREQNTALMAQQREVTTQLQASATARRLNFRNPDLAFSMIANRVEYDEEGKPKNIDKLLEDLAKSETYLVNGAKDFGQGPRGSAPSAGANIDQMIRSAARR